MGVGSGFVLDLGPIHVLVTAAHVVDTLHLTDCLIRFSRYGGAPLQNLAFHLNRSYDIAVSVLSDEWLASSGMRVVPSMIYSRITEPRVPLDDGVYIVSGYPGSGNSIELWPPDASAELRNIVTSRVESPKAINANRRLVLGFNKKWMLHSDGRPQSGISDLNGMSGAPVFHVFPYQSNDGILMHCQIAGIFVEWHRAHSILMVEPFGGIRDLIHDAIVRSSRPS